MPAPPGRLRRPARSSYMGIMSAERNNRPDPEPKQPQTKPEDSAADPKRPREIGGPKGPEPTRYGDWEIGGRCIDF